MLSLHRDVICVVRGRASPLVVVGSRHTHHAVVVPALHRIHAASLRAEALIARQGVSEKQEPARTGIPTGSTAPTPVQADGRVASDHGATPR